MSCIAFMVAFFVMMPITSFVIDYTRRKRYEASVRARKGQRTDRMGS